MTDLPSVTVLIPTRNESADITDCIDAVGSQDYPLERVQVLVVDGRSNDGTAELARAALDRYGFLDAAVICNADGSTPSNLNRGLSQASGEIICRVDARTIIEPHYVRTCAEVLRDRSDVAVVGGAQIAAARDGSVRAIGIARALNNRWTMGGSRYRRRPSSGPSDTVYLGAFRRVDLLAEGGWNTELDTNQDFDLNRRFAARGVVWFDQRLCSTYRPRTTLRALAAQYYRFGRAKVHYWRATGDRPRMRQIVLMSAPPVFAFLGGWILSNVDPRARARLAVGGAAALCWTEVRGTSVPAGPLRAHLVSMAAIAVVGAAWWLGVAASLARRSS